MVLLDLKQTFWICRCCYSANSFQTLKHWCFFCSWWVHISMWCGCAVCHGTGRWESRHWLLTGKFGSERCNDVGGVLQRVAENSGGRCHYIPRFVDVFCLLLCLCHATMLMKTLCSWVVHLPCLFVHSFVHPVWSCHHISRERLEQPWWNLQGSTISFYRYVPRF